MLTEKLPKFDDFYEKERADLNEATVVGVSDNKYEVVFERGIVTIKDTESGKTITLDDESAKRIADLISGTVEQSIEEGS